MRNKDSVWKTLGASSHTEEEREKDDYYATEPGAIDVLLGVEGFEGVIWEPACGEGHLSKRLLELGHEVISTDLVDRGYGVGGVDFLMQMEMRGRNIITNPPYKYAQGFAERGMVLLPGGGKMALFLKLQFLEGKRRKGMFLRMPPKVLYVSSSRLLCAKRGNFQKMRDGGGSAVAYGWYVWEKGWCGDTVIKWVN